MISQGSMNKRSRAIRTTSLQYKELIKYMENHSEFAAGKFLTKEGRIHYAQQWEELQKMLNALSTGPGKSTKQWQTVWRDMKSNASKKAARLRNERNRTGNFPVTAEHLDNLEQRVISCIGLEYVQGTADCPDSTPEEEEYQLQLENGNEDVLRNPPATASIAEILPDITGYASTSNNIDDHFDAPEEIQELNEDSISYCDVLQAININPSNLNQNVTVESSEISRSQQRRQQIIRNRRSRQRIGVQLQEAREHFGEIAKNHAGALQLFAEASVQQAEAALLTAQNEQRRIVLEERRFEMEERNVTSIEQLIATLNNLQKVIERITKK